MNDVKCRRGPCLAPWRKHRRQAPVDTSASPLIGSAASSGRTARGPGDALAEGQSSATDLADLPVRKRGISFRPAHNVVGKAVATVVQRTEGRTLTAALVNQIAADRLGLQLNLTDAEVSEALDPGASVEVRSTRGGPAPGGGPSNGGGPARTVGRASGPSGAAAAALKG